MAVDMRVLGKLLALTRSTAPQEALRAEEVFTTLFFKWCDEQGLPENVGFVRIGDTSKLGKVFLETLADYNGARILELNVFDLCAVGTLEDCKSLAWWFENGLPEIIETSEKSAYAEREAFQYGACRGMGDELLKRQPTAVPKSVAHISMPPAAAPAEVSPQPAADTTPTEGAAVRLPNSKEQSAMSAGHMFGRKLVQRLTATCPHPLRTT